MHRNRSQPHQSSAAATTNQHQVVTRSRSVTSRSSNSGSSSSGSSSSASSSSSSSSGSGSDSSSSDTEASRASSQSRAGSRASRSSQKSQKNQKCVSVPAGKKATQKNTPSQKSKSGATSNGANGTTTHNKNRTSGSVTNTKTIPASKTAAAKNFRRKNFVATSSESESSSAVPIPIKKVASKPNPTSKKSVPPPPTSARKKPIVASNKSATALAKKGAINSNSKSPILKTNSNSLKNSSASHKSNSTTVKNNSTAVKSNSSASKSNSASNNVVGSSRKLMKSIFSPDNSSEDSDVEKTIPPPPPSKKTASSSASSTVSATAASKKKTNDSKSKKRASPAPPPPPPKAVSSSSLSASTSASSSCSSSDSSSDSEKKPPTSPSVIPTTTTVTTPVKKEGSPTPIPLARKRPVTRRQRRTVKSKTIPTTTTFNQRYTDNNGPQTITVFDSVKDSIPTVGAKTCKSAVLMTFSVLTQSQPMVSAWDSDFSDEPRSLVRVPAKSNQKVRPKPPEEDEEEHERKCPFPGCDSQGHLSGLFPSHSMLPTCPKYHGFSTEECKENADERSKRESERRKYYVPNQPHHKKPLKMSHEGRNWLQKVKELKHEDTKDGLCSEYDLKLWNDALALAAGRVESEQGEGISHRSIAMGRYEMACWCASPYPEPLCHCRRLFVCEFCLKPVQSGTVLRRHCAKCVWRHPPGDEIYRKERLSVWEVDGKSQKTYCQNLCLLAKCFLDHKTLYLDVDPFLFYVMTLADSQGCHLVGYFSKEKNSFLNYNVSCILTLPPYQRQGFGRLLIDFSYLLTRVEGKVGSPEKPLSDLGLISYRSYWKDAVLRRMCACASREMNVKDLSIELGVTSADLVSTLQFLGMLKYWKGKHLVLKKQDVLEEYLERVRRRGEQRQIDSSCLRWRPFQPPPETQS